MSDWYLVIYDIKNNISPTQRRAIYRRLKDACRKITAAGGEFQRIQMSVWKVKGKEHAYTLVNAIPAEYAIIHIFKVMPE